MMEFGIGTKCLARGVQIQESRLRLHRKSKNQSQVEGINREPFGQQKWVRTLPVLSQV
jgi:hypothetical protein